jgi:hypothetical protein
MSLQPKVRNELQDRLDETRELEDAVPDQAPADEESPFYMTGLYEIIPGADPSPLRIDSRRATRKV